jgi:hypothetical protein
MTTEQYQLWDTAIKLVGFIGVAIGASFTYWQYFDGVRRQQATATFEAKRPFFAQRQDLYGQAIKAVGTLATSSDAAILKDAERDFWHLYWGPLATVESREVERIMVTIGICLEENQPLSARKALSLELAKQIRLENQDTWNVSLPELKKRA